MRAARADDVEAEVTRRLLALTPWRVLTVDAGTLAAQEPCVHARRRLAELLGLPTRP
ncbi:hypothetical protein [Streptomyces sp. NPDC050982]|uniref:hypothetical protein n=1 Tax=Streptomyces sp. NPDC050982 TaxID=3154746 RepID=UPI0033D7B064